VRVAYFDCFSGISGDMALGALVHAGADLATISETIGSLPVDEFVTEAERVEVHGISSVRIHIRSPAEHGVIRTYASIRSLLADADMPDEPKRTAQRIYRRLAEAAARVHGKDMELITFHEFGDLDCLIEIVGCALGLSMLGVERVFASSIPTGLGMIRTEHGVTPIPSPVVLELLQGAPTYSRGIPVELVTPTGAAILAAVSEGYGEMPLMLTDRVGYGAGHLRLDFPNVLRVVIGVDQRAGTKAESPISGSDVVLEVTIDGEDPVVPGRLIEDLMSAGALDAWATAAVGPQGRPRLSVSVVSSSERRQEIANVLRRARGAGPVRLTPVLIEDGDR
jgi:pyridinium-3,5-bisthiocarboxylic acid mononucleotide nickel chelatase